LPVEIGLLISQIRKLSCGRATVRKGMRAERGSMAASGPRGPSPPALA
jgi:hypothetical protein